MPTVREFQKKNKKRMSHYHASAPIIRPTRAKRRPGREDVDASAGHDVDEEEDEEIVETPKAKKHKAKHAKKARAVEPEDDDQDEVYEDDSQEAASVETDAEATVEERIEIQFKGSEILRAKFPKTFDLAEVVATQWLHDGNFEGLPIGHPLGQWAAQQSLLKAKKIEKKIVESPIFEKAAIRALTAGMRAQGLIQKLKDRFQKHGLD